MLNRQLAMSLASTILFEDEIRIERTAVEVAAQEAMQLTEKLAVQTARLRRMTESALVGMFSIDPQGMLQEANERWYEITGHPKPKDNHYNLSWIDTLTDDCKASMVAVSIQLSSEFF
jgi:PAS domain-containing protein